MRRLFLPLCLLLLGACVSPRSDDTASRAAVASSTLPPMKVFAAPRPTPPARSNRDIARDFLDLSFRMESGRALPVMTRFEGPITVRVTGKPPASLAADLTRLLHRLRNEAGIEISLTRAGSANITIEAVSRAEIQRALPQAACFVAPNITSLAQFRSAKRQSKTNWAALQRRDRIAVFLPNDTSPQEVRDCLHEELAQALGPLNDLYRLSDSVFNDDNVHAVLTGFDMLVLRAYYHPDLANGMTRDRVAARLPSLLARINPAGEGRSAAPLTATPRDWIEAVQTALGPGAGQGTRRRSALTALAIAQREGWQDHRLGFSYFALGRLMQARDAEKAHGYFKLADAAYRRSPDSAPHQAFVATHLAAHALSAAEGDTALRLIAPHLEVAARHENAVLLTTLMLLRAEALELGGRADEATNVRLDSLGWARYAFGPDWAVRAKLREFAALNPAKRRY
ncbi:DUF2927 domain-containing protein [Shimia sp.]|uniref:DUF2927 domain-containing protein n=1 Tax=Shimia sp. TaxID=1954381 RepID=UPI00356656DB